jgi:hypothetical protein
MVDVLAQNKLYINGEVNGTEPYLSVGVPAPIHSFVLQGLLIIIVTLKF